jgi:DNA polymerase III alpha subunit
LSKEIAGISFAETDVWRRKIMRDKSNTEAIIFSSIFANGCRDYSSLNEVEIASLTNLVSGMLRLTFQKSHSLSYSIIGYWGAYYKTHFRNEFEMVFSKDIIFQKFELY